MILFMYLIILVTIFILVSFRIQERRSQLLVQLDEVRRTRALQRYARKRRGGSDGHGLTTVAVVGYTNAVCGSTKFLYFKDIVDISYSIYFAHTFLYAFFLQAVR